MLIFNCVKLFVNQIRLKKKSFILSQSELYVVSEWCMKKVSNFGRYHFVKKYFLSCKTKCFVFECSRKKSIHYKNKKRFVLLCCDIPLNGSEKDFYNTTGVAHYTFTNIIEIKTGFAQRIIFTYLPTFLSRIKIREFVYRQRLCWHVSLNSFFLCAL